MGVKSEGGNDSAVVCGCVGLEQCLEGGSLVKGQEQWCFLAKSDNEVDGRVVTRNVVVSENKIHGNQENA